MKKSLKIFLCVICLLPLVLLSSCGITQYYTITTTESDSTLGKGNGGSDVAMAEGTEITLSANETKPETNPFICWIKDDNKIVSLEKNYSTTYSQSSSGKYTALFQETTINKTRYSTISNVEIIGASSANLQISYAYTTALQNKILLEDLNIENGISSTEKRNVLYFGGASGATNKIEFSFHQDIKNYLLKSCVKKLVFHLNNQYADVKMINQSVLIPVHSYKYLPDMYHPVPSIILKV